MSTSGEPPGRSNLVDVSYSQLHFAVCGHQEGTNAEQIKEHLNARKDQFKSVSYVFGKPSDASRKKIESGSVVLPDGVVVPVEAADKEFIFAISSKFKIDEIQAFILFRSFLYYQGLPPSLSAESSETMVEELVTAISPFYYTQRLYALRILAPLFRAYDDSSELLYEVATDFLPEIIPEPSQYVTQLLDAYLAKTKENLPDHLSVNPKAAIQWTKQSLQEQLALLEQLFWLLWSYAACTGPVVVKVFETAYNTSLGSSQRANVLILDEEGQQLQQDCAALWILITVEVLELETMGESDSPEISENPIRKATYVSSPESLMKIHEIVTSKVSSQYSCTYLAWTYIVSRLVAKTKEMDTIPPAYQPFLNIINPPLTRSYTKDPEPLHVEMSKACLSPDAGLFQLIHNLLTNSPLFVTSVSWRTGSSVTDPNAIGYRSVLKGLIIALVELVPVELLSDFDGLVDIWVAMFGRSESQSVAGICSQFWQTDWHHGIARRAIFDVARSRFPVQIKPLFRLLRAMTGCGFLDTDPLSTADHSQEGISDDRETCDRFVYYYLSHLSTYTQVIPTSACTGAHALYEKQAERYGSANANTGLTYVNIRPIKLPGGSLLSQRSTGRLLSGDGGEHVVVCWKHEHSGWKIILEILTDYVNRRCIHFRSGGSHQEVSFNRRGPGQLIALKGEDIGMEISVDGDEIIVTDALDLVRSVIQDNPLQAESLMASLEDGEVVVSHAMTEAEPPDLVQLTTMILEEALSRSNGRSTSPARIQLITSAICVLSALLANPTYSNRVWLYIRSTTVLFGSEQTPGFATIALAAERATGHYTMTLALLHLVQQLFRDASLTILPDNTKVQHLKEEVLLRAVRFVHSEIWVEHLGWKYAQMGDRFEIGRRVASLYENVLQHAPPTLEDRPFPVLSQAVADVLLFKATASTISPLVSSISTAGQVTRMLYASRRFADVRRLYLLLVSLLRLSRMVLNIKLKSPLASRQSLLELALCARVAGGSASQENNHTKQDPIDVLATYVKDREAGNDVPLEAIRLLCTLANSLSLSQPSPPTIIGHLSDPEGTVIAFVRIIQHPYDDLELRITLWNFISLVVDTEPALGRLFITGTFHIPSELRVTPATKDETSKALVLVKKEEERNALSTSRESLLHWKQLWEINPQLLAAILHFYNVVWQHALEHKAALQSLRSEVDFWATITDIVCEEVGPVPEYETTDYVVIDKVKHSNHHESVSPHAYRNLAKSYAVRLISLDIGFHLQSNAADHSIKKPQSLLALEPKFSDEEELGNLLSEAAPSPYAPHLHDSLVTQLNQDFAGLSLKHLELQEPVMERLYGDGFSFSLPLLQDRLHAYQDILKDAMDDPMDAITKAVLSINLNLSLTHAQTALAESWETLLRQLVPYLRGDPQIRPILMSTAASISSGVALEQRPGDMMAAIHGTRLSLLLSILEVAWFSSSDKQAETFSFVELARNVSNIIMNEAQPPTRSFVNSLPNPFHRVLLQILFFCAKESRTLLGRPKALNSNQRLIIGSMVEAALNLVTEGLRVIFASARGRLDLDLDRDMELLAAVFEQCSRPDITPSSTFWLSRCQETDVMRASLELFVRTDLVGVSDLPLLLSRKHPLYAPHILLFHMAVVSNPTAAERIASEGLLAAYSSNTISASISAGSVHATLPELPGERSPAHLAYCSMLSIVATVVSALGRHNHYFDAEACGFVQLYGDQISRALSWTVGDTITLPFVEEIEQVVNLFYSIAASVPTSAKSNPAVDKVLRVFTNHSLLLIQQLNYAITHPNHLASLFEPVTNNERIQHEKAQSIADPLKRPIIAHLVHRLFRLSSNIIGTLLCISKVDTILCNPQEDWPLGEAILVPHSKVVLGEPASLGTLLELGNCSLDVLKDLVNLPAGQSLIPATPAQGHLSKPLDVRQGVITARRNLESILVYMVTQLAMWLSKPDFDTPGPDGDLEDTQATDVQRMEGVKERRAPRSTISMAERLRRGMTGEMASDLQSLLNKSKPIIAKSSALIGKETVDVTQILTNFLHDRITPTS